MQPERRLFGLLAALGILLGAARADAQLSYRLAPIGGRSQLLGGTGITFGRDASASFLNPATAVLVDDQRLSFSVNFYKLTYMHASNWYAPGPVDPRFGNIDVRDRSMTDIDFDTPPSSLCFYFFSSKLNPLAARGRDEALNNAHVGLCLATIQSEEFNYGAEDFSKVQPNNGVTRQAQTLSQRYSQFAAGPTYALRVNNWLSIGASVHASIITHRSLLTASAVTYGTPASAITSSFYGASKGTSFQLAGTAGMTARFGKQTLGLSVRSPTVHVFGVGGVNREATYDGAGSETFQLAANGSFLARQPMRVGVGTGVEGTWGSLEIDAFYFHHLDAAYRAELEGFQTTKQNGTIVDQPVTLDLAQRSNGVVNLAAGAELFMSPRISLLTGVSGDVSGAPAGTLRGTLFNYFALRQNRLTASLGIGTHGAAGELMLGTELAYGWGERLAVNSYQLPPEIGTARHETYQLMFVVAGSTSLRALKRAVEDMKEVVREPTRQKPVLEPKPQKPIELPGRREAD
ncbi:MAG: hypothetical protein KIT84_42785 [Labilithrix sp.]|nr:hypothetical protein [Labilithrix sp.]MCW5817805.1 hypothetical protein [Labilithrix sp.]